MANISTYLEEKLLNHVFRNTDYDTLAAVYCGIVTSTGTDAEMEAGTFTNEVTTYDEETRPAITFGVPS